MLHFKAMEVKKCCTYMCMCVLLVIISNLKPYVNLSKVRFFKHHFTNSTQNNVNLKSKEKTQTQVRNTSTTRREENITKIDEVWNIPDSVNVTGNTSTTSIEKKMNYTKLGKEKLEEAITILDSGVWNFEWRTEDGDSIFTRSLLDGHTVLRLTGVVNMPAKELFFILHYGLEDYPKWNPSFLECRVLEKIDDHTDISYQVSTPAARGCVVSRDFITLRYWVKRGNDYISGTSSVDYDGVPNKGYTRGENGPGCWELRPMNSDSNKTEFRWLMNTRLNGWIPQIIADKAFKKFMAKYVINLRKYCSELKKNHTELLSS